MKRNITQTTGVGQMVIGKKTPACILRSPFFVLLLILPAILFTSCLEVIDVKESNENLNLIGVDAEINTLDQPTVFLYRTLNVNKTTAYPGIRGAQVTLSDDASPSNTMDLQEDPKKPGRYVVPSGKSYPGEVGREYTLTIKTGEVTLTAKDKLSKVEPIDSITVGPAFEECRFLGVFVYGKEPRGVANYYKWDTYVNGKQIYNEDFVTAASDEFVDGDDITNLLVYTDYVKNNGKRKIKLNDVVQVRQTSISKFACDYYEQMKKQLGNQNEGAVLFSVPPANIKSNFTSSDGKPVLGLFVARDVSLSNKVTVTQEIEDQLDK